MKTTYLILLCLCQETQYSFWQLKGSLQVDRAGQMIQEVNAVCHQCVAIAMPMLQVCTMCRCLTACLLQRWIVVKKLPPLSVLMYFWVSQLNNVTEQQLQ